MEGRDSQGAPKPGPIGTPEPTRYAGPIGALATAYDIPASVLTGGKASAAGLVDALGFQNAARYIDDEKAAFVGHLEPLFDALQVAGEVAAARASAGGPAGAISNSIRLATSAPFTRHGREALLDARAERRLPELRQEYSGLRAQLHEHGGYAPAPVQPRPIGHPYWSKRERRELEAGYDDSIERIREIGPQAYGRFLEKTLERDLSNALPSRTSAMPGNPVPQGRSAVVDASVDPTVAMTPAERVAAERAQFRAWQQASQPNYLATVRRRQQVDSTVDDFVSQASTRGLYEGEGPVSNPAELARVLKETAGIPVRDVLSSMERLGYRLDWFRQHHVQGRQVNGRFEPIDDRLREFWDEIRARRRRG